MAFKKGEPRPQTAGRKAGTPNKRSQSLFDLCDEMDFNPFKAMLTIAKDDTHKDSAMMLKEVAKYLYPARKAIELSATLDPKLQEAAESLTDMSKEEKIALLQDQIKELKNG